MTPRNTEYRKKARRLYRQGNAASAIKAALEKGVSGLDPREVPRTTIQFWLFVRGQEE